MVCIHASCASFIPWTWVPSAPSYGSTLTHLLPLKLRPRADVMLGTSCTLSYLADLLSPSLLALSISPCPDSREALSLALRHKVAIGVAQALKFLHSFSQPKIIHRDLQSDSILLDADFKVKVGGLGLLKHLPGDSLRLRMASKKGYLDPEYFQTFKVTTKCDVYSFGVVLFEMLTGCAPMVQISRSETQRTFTLAQWVSNAVPQSLHSIMPLQLLACHPGFQGRTPSHLASVLLGLRLDVVPFSSQDPLPRTLDGLLSYTPISCSVF